MSTLASILEEFTGATVLGHHTERGRTAAKKHLSKRLQEARQANERYLMLCVGMVVMMFGVSLWVILSNMSQPVTVIWTITALGATTGVVVGTMIWLWREKSVMDLLLALAEGAEGNVLEQVVSILEARVLRSSNTARRRDDFVSASGEPSRKTASTSEIHPRPPTFAKPPSGARISDETLNTVYTAAVNAGLGDSQTALLKGTDPAFAQALSQDPNSAARLLSTLHALNGVVLVDGAVPLRSWLTNAQALAGPKRESRIFQMALVELDAGRSAIDAAAAP